ncbi:DUF29 domain-containing protein [Gloeocapsa sp. PCC 73106]|uniref:DUF29 domain-containing protein n=1 Tax=Gloeocapsa sp. PCC 73106 TaxID=102232 RepID=UPI0002ACFB38|nr:DUF29 domain-containing protein [Gloeocapsa sp. PCC 73106]ELR98672.1 protein of unknown function DUF29 [Gloeocapsa sp. PCC 73106]
MNHNLDLTTIYETDYLQWVEAMITLLKNRQLSLLDYEHLIEELEELGRREKSTVKSLLLQIIIHLLLLEYWESEKENNQNHWSAEIITFRVQLEDKLTTNLENYLGAELEQIYANARLIAQKKTGINYLPEKCPYTLVELLNKTWFPVTLD